MITYLYHKRHTITGLNYFGKTIRDPYKYVGSGLYWKRHLEKHGKDIETIQVWKFDNLEECKKFATEFSIKNNIVESKDWANFVIENGIDGQSPGFKNTKLSEYNKSHNKNRKNQPGYIPNRLGKKDSLKTLEKKRESHLGKKIGRMTETRYEKHMKMIFRTNASRSVKLTGKNNPMFEKTHSEETINRMKDSRKGKVWWNNGKVGTMSIECPEHGYVRGRLTDLQNLPSNTKPVKTPLGEFPSLTSAANAFNVSNVTIRRWIKAKEEFCYIKNDKASQ